MAWRGPESTPASVIPVFFRAEMAADSESFSPSAAKPAAVVEDWRRHGLDVELRSFEPVDRATLSLAHDPDHVREVLDCLEPNGFGNRSRSVARSLPFTSGAMLAAARAAVESREVACAPVSGFHHAAYDRCGGYCTLNGLMVTALAIKRDGLADTVGILDLDQHYGDGTEDIIHRQHAGFVQHHTAGRTDREAGPDARAFLGRLPSLVSSFFNCQVLLYQAGADPHVDDPLGGWMTTDELAERDEIVFEVCAKLGIPIAWNLAGGYQRDESGSIEPVLTIHRNTMKACLKAYG